jgi:colanic acid/amylovoran biosynthesis glycosyltransferase
VSFYGVDATQVPRENRWRKRYKELFDKVDAILCEGPHMASTIQELGCPPEKTHLYHLGVDVELIKFQRPSWDRGKTLQILMAATFTEKKGIPYGLEAIAGFMKKRKDINVRVTIVGDSINSKESRREKEKINKVIQENRLENIVAMKGYCSHPELLTLATEHHLFSSPSISAVNGDTEGGAPVSIIEMAAAGLMIVSTKHCDIPNVLGERNRQLLVNERDSKALAVILEWLVENQDQWQAIGDENRLRVESEFNIRNQGPALARIYESFFEGRSHGTTTP